MYSPKTHWISSVLEHRVIPEAFLQKENKVVLDLGCRTPKDLFYLFNTFEKFEQLYGIDNNSHFDDNGNSKMELMLEGANTAYGYYQKFSFERGLTNAQFEQVFHINLNISAEAFFETNTEYFDFIILSNFLHMYAAKENAKSICKSAISSLNPGGIIYVSIACENHEYASHPNRTTYREAEVLSLFHPLKEILFLRTESHYQGLFLKN